MTVDDVQDVRSLIVVLETYMFISLPLCHVLFILNQHTTSVLRYRLLHDIMYIYSRAADTVLGESADSTELFLVDECDNIEAESVEGKVEVIFHTASQDWFNIGGLEDGESPVPKDRTDSYFYHKWCVSPLCYIHLCYML